MNATDRFEKQIIFGYIIDQVQCNKKNINKTGKIYITEGIEFLNEVRKGLEYIAKKKFPEQENLKEIYETISGKKKVSKKLILEVASQVKEVQSQLESLAENPEEFYKNTNTGKLLYICKKIKDVYSIPNKLWDMDWEDIDRAVGKKKIDDKFYDSGFTCNC
jgi:DNA-directed RNA polymerase subunit F